MSGVQELVAMLLMFFAGGFGLPLGIPPAPEDPLLARIAPEQCLVYASWSGIDTPDPDSRNTTEQLLAEPEVIALFGEFERRMTRRMRELAQNEQDPRAAQVLRLVPMLAKILLTRPAAMYVANVQVTPDSLDVDAGLLVNAGEQAALEVRRALKKLQDESLGDQVTEVEIGGASFYQFRLSPKAPLVTWGSKGAYLAVGMGDDSVQDMFERGESDPPQWLVNLRRQLPVERTSSITYLNLEKILAIVTRLAEVPNADAILDALGLGDVTSYASVAGLDETGYVNRSLLAVDGRGAGLLSWINAPPLTADDLVPIPRDTPLAIALRLDAGRLFDSAVQSAGKINPRAEIELREGLLGFEKMLGFKLRDDLLGSLGDVWCLYAAPSDGGLLTGWTVAVQVRDRARLATVHDRLLAFARQGFGEDERAPSIKRLRFADHEIYYLSTSSGEMPLAPAWCLTEKQLVMGLFPQTIKAFLGRDDAFSSLAENPEVAQLLKRDSGPIFLSYYDSRQLFQIIYSTVQMVAQFALNQARREGADIEIGIMPSAAAVAKHLLPGVSSMHRTGAGVEIARHQTLPGGSIGSTTPVMLGLLLPAVQAAREAARRTQSMNNLKQIGLALHNYHDAFRAFPAAHNTDKDGNPLLSWRVQVLPFIEQNQLYDRFHFDEPWDSEHNKQLIPLMPPTYASPGSRAESGRTNYLGVAGKNGVFAAPKDRDNGVKSPRGTVISGITDGTSNTVMVVEANDQSAVIWTKPHDFTPDPGDPINGLIGIRPGGFLALFGDGSVRFISQEIAAEMLNALFTRNGGEVVDID